MFLQDAASVKKIAIWVRIPRLPLELYNSNFLWRIGSGLGTMLKIDRLTSIHSRGQYARICVEMDLDKPLKSFILIRGHRLFLEYEGLHLICFQCGKYGHKATQCGNLAGKEDKEGPSNAQVSRTNNNSQPDVGSNTKNLTTTSQENLGKFGPWMVASRRQRKQQPAKKSAAIKESDKKHTGEGPKSKPSHIPAGSRFTALNSEGMGEYETIRLTEETVVTPVECPMDEGKIPLPEPISQLADKPSEEKDKIPTGNGASHCSPAQRVRNSKKGNNSQNKGKGKVIQVIRDNPMKKKASPKPLKTSLKTGIDLKEEVRVEMEITREEIKCSSQLQNPPDIPKPPLPQSTTIIDSGERNEYFKFGSMTQSQIGEVESSHGQIGMEMPSSSNSAP